jgi:hypothetical protein
MDDERTRFANVVRAAWICGQHETQRAPRGGEIDFAKRLADPNTETGCFLSPGGSYGALI